VERERHATDHATLGYLVAKGWFLPEAICEGILYHHDPAAFTDREGVSPRAQTLIAINVLAECFHDENIRLRDTSAWARMGSQALEHLGLTDGEYCDLREDLTAMVRLSARAAPPLPQRPAVGVTAIGWQTLTGQAGRYRLR
jgi:HD-like signal output (HDOD) protein